MRLVLLVLVFVILSLAEKTPFYSGIGIDEVERTIDLSKPNMVKHTISVTASNVGTKSASSIFLTLPKELASKTALFEASVNSATKELTTQGVDNSLNKDATFYELPLEKSLNANDRVKFTLTLIVLDTVRPYPEFIKQKDNQKLLLLDNLYFFSPYSVKKQQTTVKLAGSPIEAFSEIRPYDRRGGDIIFGPYNDQKPFAVQELRVHFLTNFQFGVVTKAERVLEISHWGNLAVEETYEIRHAGAKLKGSFSRLDYSRGPSQTSPTSFRSFFATLPLHASDIYYRDRIGNISTSNCKETSDKKNLEVEFQARFPLFGGWKTSFYFGYNVPVQEFLNADGSNMYLNALFGIPFEYPVEDYTVKVIIPEGASNVKPRVPFSVDSVSYDTIKTYLDVTGRTVLILKKKNVVPYHNQIFTTSYSFAPVGLLQEPLLVIGALFGFCVFIMAYVRFDLTIHETEDVKKQEVSARLVELIEVYTDKNAERLDLYTAYENSSQSDADFKNLKAAKEKISASISEVISEIAKMDTSVAQKVANIEKEDKSKFDLLQNLREYQEKKNTKGIQAAEDEYNKASVKIADLVDDLNQTVE